MSNKLKLEKERKKEKRRRRIEIRSHLYCWPRGFHSNHVYE